MKDQKNTIISGRKSDPCGPMCMIITMRRYGFADLTDKFHFRYATLTHIYSPLGLQYDYFHIGGDDLYLIVENMRLVSRVF